MKDYEALSKKHFNNQIYYLLKEYWGEIGLKKGIKDFKNTTAKKLPNKELKKWKE